LSDELHDAKVTLKDAAKALTEAQHDEAIAVEASAAQAFLKAGDDFYAAHCALAETIDVRVKLRNKIAGLPEHTGGGYAVEVLLVPPGRLNIHSRRTHTPAAQRLERSCVMKPSPSIEERVAAILALVEELCSRRAITDKPFDPMDAPGQYKARDKAAFTGRAAALVRIDADHKRIEAINAKLPSR
jgi:hypothetical protein